MRTIGRSKLIKSFIAITIVVITVATTYFIAMQFDKQPANPPDNGKATPDDTIIDDIDGDEKSTPLSDNEDKPEENIPQTSAICNGDIILADSYTLKTPALVYGTALEAKNKINPANTYAAGEYKIFRC